MILTSDRGFPYRGRQKAETEAGVPASHPSHNIVTGVSLEAGAGRRVGDFLIFIINIYIILRINKNGRTWHDDLSASEERVDQKGYP